MRAWEEIGSKSALRGGEAGESRPRRKAVGILKEGKNDLPL